MTRDINVMDFQIYNNSVGNNDQTIHKPELKIHRFFNLSNNNLDSTQIGARDNNTSISLQNVVNWMNLNNDNNNKLAKSLYKTSLDFLKFIIFRSAMEGVFDTYFSNQVPLSLSKILQNGYWGNMYFLNDIVAADKAALFIPGTVVNEVPETYVFKEFFSLFIPTNILIQLPENKFIRQQNIINDGAPPLMVLNIGAFGKKKNFIQEANEKSQKKGTIGTFGKWCRFHGLSSPDGKVTKSCINAAKKSGNTKLIHKAVFAQNINAYVGAVKNKKGILKKIESIEKYLKGI